MGTHRGYRIAAAKATHWELSKRHSLDWIIDQLIPLLSTEPGKCSILENEGEELIDLSFWEETGKKTKLLSILRFRPRSSSSHLVFYVLDLIN